MRVNIIVQQKIEYSIRLEVTIEEPNITLGLQLSLVVVLLLRMSCCSCGKLKESRECLRLMLDRVLACGFWWV